MPEDMHVELFTKDTDWWQGLSEKVHWFSPFSKKTVTLEFLANPDNELKDGYFLSVDEYLKCKALAGDASDTIPGINKVGLITAAKYIREFGSMETYWNRVDSGEKFNGKILETLASHEARAIYYRNLELMDWKKAPKYANSDMALTCMTPCLEDFNALCEEYGLKQIEYAAKIFIENREKWIGKLPYITAQLTGSRRPILENTAFSRMKG